MYPLKSIHLCLNASPLKEFISNDDLVIFNCTNDNTPTVIYTSTVAPNNTIMQSSTSAASNWDQIMPRKQIQQSEQKLNGTVDFESYRKGVKSWMSWQDSFVLPVFLLIALLSIGAIVAFKVLKRFNYILTANKTYFREKMFILSYPG